MQNIYYENYPKQNSNFNCKATDNIKCSEYKNAPKTRKNRNSKPKIAAAVFVWSTILLGAFSLNLPNFIEPVYLNRDRYSKRYRTDAPNAAGSGDD